MTFSEALELLKAGRMLTREPFRETFIIGLMEPGEKSDMSEPYLYISYIVKRDVKAPWFLTNQDLFADDWVDMGVHGLGAWDNPQPQ